VALGRPMARDSRCSRILRTDRDQMRSGGAPRHETAPPTPTESRRCVPRAAPRMWLVGGRWAVTAGGLDVAVGAVGVLSTARNPWRRLTRWLRLGEATIRPCAVKPVGRSRLSPSMEWCVPVGVRYHTGMATKTTVNLDDEMEAALAELIALDGSMKLAIKRSLLAEVKRRRRSQAVLELIASWEAETGPIDREHLAWADHVLDRQGVDQ